MKSATLMTGVALFATLLTACDAPRVSDVQSLSGTAARSAAMKPSVTYLFLLRHTPFFTRLSTAQLRQVIEHSHEWEAPAGAVVDECVKKDSHSAEDAAGSPGIWILLDGSWQVEYAGRRYPADHSGAGKWFSTTLAGDVCRLVTTEHSYVMKIERADFDAMLAQGFDFGAHLDAGRRYYAGLFNTTAAPLPR